MSRYIITMEKKSSFWQFVTDVKLDTEPLVKHRAGTIAHKVANGPRSLL
jgi:hypothetical protein